MAEPRVRRTAEEARRLILDAAEKRLREGGPEAIRLLDIARDVGISHPTILHHFETREGLMEALERRAIDGLEADLVAVLQRAPATQDTALDVITRVAETLGDAGHARLLAWQALRSSSDDDSEGETLRQLAELVHARRIEYRREHHMNPPSQEDSQFIVRLTAAAMLGDGVFGSYFDSVLGRGDDPDVRRRFRAWFARLLLESIERP